MSAPVEAEKASVKKDKNAKLAAKNAKAERRAAAKTGSSTASQGSIPPPSPGQVPQSTGTSKPNKKAAPSSNATPAAETSRKKTPDNDPLQLFLHLDSPTKSQSLCYLPAAPTANIHPSIIKLALQTAEFKIVSANDRCIAFIQALKDVIVSYVPPPQTLLYRHLPTTHLNPQINHLIRARPLCVSMGSALRYLKYEITQLDASLSVDESKTILLERLDSFVNERIILAGKVIQYHANSKICNGDVVLTYGRSALIEELLVEAWESGKRFEVVVVDSVPMYGGKELVKTLNAYNIPTTYLLLSSLLSAPKPSIAILDTAALLCNGAMYARAGTAMVAMMMNQKAVPVVCVCETYKFSERVMLDSIVGNEMGSSVPLESNDVNLLPLRLLYDVSRPEDVTAVITEAGIIPVQSVNGVMRDYKPLLGVAA